MMNNKLAITPKTATACSINNFRPKFIQGKDFAVSLLKIVAKKYAILAAKDVTKDRIIRKCPTFPKSMCCPIA